MMEKGTNIKHSFVIQILNTQNATWQGTITWLDGKHTQPFRSLLEMIKLIDSTLETDSETAET